MKTFKITFDNTAINDCQTIIVQDDEYILDSAEKKGIKIPFSCRTGSCATCVAKVKYGSVDQPEQSFLDDSQLQEGYILPCVSFPKSDLVLETNAEESLY